MIRTNWKCVKWDYLVKTRLVKYLLPDHGTSMRFTVCDERDLYENERVAIHKLLEFSHRTYDTNKERNMRHWIMQMNNIARRTLMLFGDTTVDGTDYKPHQRREIQQQTKRKEMYSNKGILMYMGQMRQCTFVAFRNLIC
eukprot:1153824_1